MADWLSFILYSDTSPGSTKLANAETQLSSVQGENRSLNEELSRLKSESRALTEKEEALKLRAVELEGELRETKITMETSQFPHIYTIV